MDDTLAELGLAEKPRVTAFNKVDLLAGRDGSSIAGIEELAEYELGLAANRPDAVLVSAERGWGLDELLVRIDEAIKLSAKRQAPAGWQQSGWSTPTPSSRR